MLIKICGITRPADAANAAALGADLVGMVFAPSSARAVSIEVAREIVLALSGEVRTVGVFVNEDPGRIEAVRRQVGFDLAQLHGDETPETNALLVRRLGGRVIKAFRGEPSLWVAPAESYDGVMARLFDAPEPGRGERWNWRSVAHAPRDRPVVLAGGLTPENLEQAVDEAGPDGVDVSSGVESAIGIKDVAKLRDFIQAARALDPEMEEPE